MRNIFFVSVVFASFFFAGCKKNNDASFKSYLTFNLDGVPIVCTANIKATIVPTTIGPDKIITVTGQWDGGILSIELNEQQVLTTSIYSFTNGSLRTANLLTFGPAGRTYSANWGGAYNALAKGSGHVTFTEINAKYAKGSFNFVTHVDAATNTFKSITGGVFHIKRS